MSLINKSFFDYSLEHLIMKMYEALLEPNRRTQCQTLCCPCQYRVSLILLRSLFFFTEV